MYIHLYMLVLILFLLFSQSLLFSICTFNTKLSSIKENNINVTLCCFMYIYAKPHKVHTYTQCVMGKNSYHIMFTGNSRSFFRSMSRIHINFLQPKWILFIFLYILSTSDAMNEAKSSIIAYRHTLCILITDKIDTKDR